MTALKQRLLMHLETVAGERLDMVSTQASALPLFLRERYELYAARLFGREVFLAFEVEGWEGGSPSEYGKHAETMRNSLGKAVVVVLPILPSYARNRMVQMGIPFIVPGNQVFLPGSLIDLREHFPQANPKKREWLGPAAQCTMLFHLLRTPLQGISLKNISGKLEYSPMMLTKVKDELEAAGLCKTVRKGRSLVMEFVAHGQSLWELALPHLRSPVKKTHWVQWRHPGPSAKLAGMSALSRKAAITDDRLPTYALAHSAFQGYLEQGVCVGCQDAEEAAARIELWSYPPERLANGEAVDPLSLLLSLRHSADERVQQQLEQIIQDIKW